MPHLILGAAGRGWFVGRLISRRAGFFTSVVGGIKRLRQTLCGIASLTTKGNGKRRALCRDRNAPQSLWPAGCPLNHHSHHNPWWERRRSPLGCATDLCSGAASDRDPFFANQLLHLPRASHLANDIAAANKLPFDIKLGNRGPVRIFLDTLA